MRYSRLKKKARAEGGQGGNEVCDVNVNVTERRRANRLRLTPDAGADQIRRNLGFFFECEEEESVCCLLLYRHPPSQRHANLVWLRDDYVSSLCTVSLRHLKVLASLCFFSI